MTLKISENLKDHALYHSDLNLLLSFYQVQQQQQQQHPHVPVTPISQLQPKHNLVYRRGPPVPPPPSAGAGFRGGVQPGTIHLQQARPVCDHTNCLQRKQSFCYKSQRSRMLSMSLHKLHMARQNHEGCLRRSVLICNMLRYIEDESEKEAFQEQTSVAHQPFGPPSIVAPPLGGSTSSSHVGGKGRRGPNWGGFGPIPAAHPVYKHDVNSLRNFRN